MTVSKSRGATKKLGPISIGSRIIRFKIPTIDRRFTVHEDLICHTSHFFKSNLQKHRKPLIPESECCVCAEPLDPSTRDITFCVTCGQNVHESCIETWKRHRGHDIDRPPPTCPMCRASWKNEPLLKYLSVDAEVDAQAVQSYLDWLYTSRLHIEDSISRKSDAFNLRLLKLWAVADAVEDRVFKYTVLVMFFEEAKARFWTDSVHWAFVERRGNEEIRGFVIEVFKAGIGPGWFKKEAERWPDGFVRELADDIFRGVGRVKTFAEVKREWMRRLESTVERVSDGEEDGGSGSTDESSGSLYSELGFGSRAVNMGASSGLADFGLRQVSESLARKGCPTTGPATLCRS